MVKYHTDSEKGNLLPPHMLLFPINSMCSFICTTPQTGLHIPQPFSHHSWSTGWNEKLLNGLTDTKNKSNVTFIRTHRNTNRKQCYIYQDSQKHKPKAMLHYQDSQTQKTKAMLRLSGHTETQTESNVTFIRTHRNTKWKKWYVYQDT